MKIYVAGHRGMVGSAIVRQLKAKPTQNAPTEILTQTHAQLDLTDQTAVAAYFQEARPDAVILAAAKVGGIYANKEYPVDFLYENLMIQNNVIHAAHSVDTDRLLFLGSSCIYPKFAEQPINEASILTGVLEETNEPYAIAKIAGIKLCEAYCRQFGRDYRSVMPSNLYGPHDNFHPENSHVLPALIHRFHEAKRDGLGEVVLWGSGTPMREFLHVDDMARALLFVFELDRAAYALATSGGISHLNIGSGDEISIRDLAELVAEATGYDGEIVLDYEKPDGTPRKLMDSSRLRSLGWSPQVKLKAGIEETYHWYRSHVEAGSVP